MTLSTIQCRGTVSRAFISIGVTTGSHTGGHAYARPRWIDKIMIVSGIQPTASGCMTYAAIDVGRHRKVSTERKSRRRYSVVTARLGTRLTRHRGMIKHSTGPGIGAVTSIAGQCGGDMRGSLAYGNHIIVAVLTGVCGLAVVNGIQGIPAIAGMASLAHIAGYRMTE